ncbi:hypothetical protein K469DRAFT_720043 [Zopfia rhizophila CBS 207.26]|uniref:Uncharacterized protein n=1 Tax=Zopfia rhizophila CBS 207.26 TaxID=1314779 RepID=A0A6A6EJZ1_9PEZI|nr:hypothetical protein K469DRAFT_720043 [Zopfia rhizophila CBS 207.26]
MDSDDRILLSSRMSKTCLKAEFDVGRLNRIHQHLWWAGRPVPARPLHRQRMLGREIVITQQADFHLLWVGQKIFVKPLPGYLLDHAVWTNHLCKDKELHGMAQGFLLSYIWLIRYQSDINIAKENHLLPSGTTWDSWKAFVDSMTEHSDFNSTETINKRYIYGELRIKRLNQIYRLISLFPLNLQTVIRGYASGYNSYGSFFHKNFAWIFIVFAYASILLSALQVGIGVDCLRTHTTFQTLAYGVTIMAILLPFSIAAVVGLLFVGLFLYHLVKTLGFERKREVVGRRWRDEDGLGHP